MGTRNKFFYKLVLLLLFIYPLIPEKLELANIYVFRIILALIFMFLIIAEGEIVWDRRISKSIIVFSMLMLLPLIYNNCINQVIIFFTDIFLPIYIGFTIVKKEKDIEQVLKVLIASASILCVLSVFEAYSGINIPCSFWNIEVDRNSANSYRMGIARTASTFGTSINYCTFLNLILVVLLYLIISKKNKKLFPIYVLVFIASLLTVSRGPLLIGLIIQLYVFAKCRNLKKRFQYAAIIIGMITLLLVGIYVGVNYLDEFNLLIASVGVIIYPEKFSYIARQYGIGDASERILLFSRVYESVKGHLLFGVGNEPFSVMISQWREKDSIEIYYLALFHMSGMTGVLGYFFFVINFLREIWPKKLFKYHEEDNLSYMFFGFVLAVMYFALILTVDDKNECVIFYLLVGTILAFKYKVGKCKNENQ